jgi:hypothetical protein
MQKRDDGTYQLTCRLSSRIPLLSPTTRLLLDESMCQLVNPAARLQYLARLLCRDQMLPPSTTGKLLFRSC